MDLKQFLDDLTVLGAVGAAIAAFWLAAATERLIKETRASRIAQEKAVEQQLAEAKASREEQESIYKRTNSAVLICYLVQSAYHDNVLQLLIKNVGGSAARHIKISPAQNSNVEFTNLINRYSHIYKKISYIPANGELRMDLLQRYSALDTLLSTHEADYSILLTYSDAVNAHAETFFILDVTEAYQKNSLLNKNQRIRKAKPLHPPKAPSAPAAPTP